MYKRAITFTILFVAFLSPGLKAQCVADFTGPLKVCSGDTARFQFTGSGSHVFWDFDDPQSGSANTDTLLQPHHVFSEPGMYHVRLIATDSACADTLITQVYQLNPTQVSLSFSNPCQNLSMPFEAHLALDSLDAGSQYNWFVGTQWIDSGQSIQYTPADTGLLQITLRVVTQNQCVDSITRNLTIKPLPVVQLSSNETCVEQGVTFSVVSGLVNGMQTQWRFGDGSSSTSNPVEYSFNSPGIRYYTLTTSYSDTTQCFIEGDSLQVFNLPTAELLLLSDTVQCFDGNEFCFQVQNHESDFLFRSITFGDGAINDSWPADDSIICYSYSDIPGGVYDVSIEIINRYGCSNTETYEKWIEVYPEFRARFANPFRVGCDTTRVFLNNTSTLPLNRIHSFRWDFGDGTLDTVNWNPQHTYSDNGNFTIHLWAQNDLGCEDSFTIHNAVRNISIDLDARIDSFTNFCRRTNVFHFEQTQIPDASEFYWFFEPEDTIKEWSVQKRFNELKVYNPYFWLRVGSCVFIKHTDSVEILPPLARIDGIENNFQCQIQDTVYFNNGSIYRAGSSRIAFWDLGHGSSCTTDLVRQQNVDGTCRFSVDSVRTLHWYPPGSEQCYGISLIAIDTVSGCRDTAFSSVALGRPNAAADPTQAGLQFFNTLTCMGDHNPAYAFVPNLLNTTPSCGRQDYWIMWDSLKAAQSGNFNGYWEQRPDSHFYTFDDPPADPDGWVTMGLVITNGRDTTGRICSDTAWYHHKVQVERYDPKILSDYNPSQHYCNNQTFTFRLEDTTQNLIQQVNWIWGDGTSTTVTSDFFEPLTHTYRSGVFQVRTQVFTTGGCMAEDTLTVRFGVTFFNNHLSGSQGFSSQFCVNEPISINAIPNYGSRGNTRFFWLDSNRYNQNKERIEWDFNDGQGYRSLGVHFVDSFPFAGRYSLNARVYDSMGCVDSFFRPDYFSVRSVKGNILFSTDTLICAQSFSMQSHASQFDSLSPFPQDTGGILSYKWDFDNGTTLSTQPNPTSFFREGVYQVRLWVENETGCIDSTSRELVVAGPQALFEFVSDSTGCEPLRVVFNNLSTSASRYTWRFNDSNQNVLTNQSDTQVFMDYKGFGDFYPTLTAQGNFLRNGIPISCTNVFPDSLQTLRRVRVYETPSPQFTHQTNCFTNTTQFTNTTVANQAIITDVFWDFGDGNTSTLVNPVHTYSDTGSYWVRMYCDTDEGCSDSVVQLVVIAPVPIPDFSFSDACPGVLVDFTNLTQSFNDIITRFDWNFGDSTTSLEENPSHAFDSSGQYRVQLKVRNRAGCTDSIAKWITIHAVPDVQFGFSNFCENEDILLQNQSSVLGSNLSYEWFFSDQTGSTDVAPTKWFSNPGTYSIQLVATSDEGCLDSLSRNISILAKPRAAMSVNTLGLCFKGHEFTLSDQTQLSLGSYTRFWNLGDQRTGTAQNLSHSYADSGSYWVTLTVVSDEGCSDTTSQRVEVWPNLEPQLRVDALESCFLGNRFRFTDLTPRRVANFNRSWHFHNQVVTGDSILETGFSDTGVFVVQLITQTPKGCIDTAQDALRVIPMPVSQITWESDVEQCLKSHLFTAQFSSVFPNGKQQIRWLKPNMDTDLSDTLQWLIGQTGSHRVGLEAVGIGNCRDTSYASVYVHPMPRAAFQLVDSLQCLRGNQFEPLNMSTIDSGNLSYTWIWDDGTSTVGVQPQKTFSDWGLFFPSLIAQSGFGCLDTFVSQLEVYEMPVSVATVNQAQQCINVQNFIFSDSSQISQGSYQVLWQLGNGDSSLFSVAQTYYHSAGDYTAKLIVTSGFGCVDTSSLNVRVFEKPQARFSVMDSAQCQFDNRFVFDNTSLGPADTLMAMWDFADGNTSGAWSPEHNYTVTDTLSVMLIVITEEGCADSVSRTVIVYPKPQSGIHVNNSEQCINPNEFLLTSNSSVSYGSIVGYEWQLDSLFNSGILQSDTLVYSFESWGRFVAGLRIETEFGCKDTSEQMLRVFPKPEASFNLDSSKQCLNAQAFEFVNTSYIPEGTLTYTWHSGDGNVFEGWEPLFEYGEPDTFVVTLKALSDQMCRDTFRSQLVVWPVPEPDFSLIVEDSCINTQQIITQNRSRILFGDLDFDWDWGYGAVSQDSNVRLTFPVRGLHPVRLIATSDLGCVDSTMRWAHVVPKPEADFVSNDTAQCLFSNRFEFANQSTDTLGIARQAWNMGGVKTDTQFAVDVVFNDTGFYTIQLRVTSLMGCKDTVSKQVYVKPMPDPSFEQMEDFYCNNSGPYNLAPSVVGGTFYGKNIEMNAYLPRILWRDTISYVVTVNGCTDSSVQFTQVFPAPVVDLGPDTFLCKNELLDLDATFWNSNYQWHDLSRNPVRLIKAPGTYSVRVTNMCGDAFDTVTVTYGKHNCRMFLPNAFSPNADGLNDTFTPLAYDVDSYEMLIYNRWGEKVYQGDHHSPGWDGTYMGKPCPQGVYVVLVSYTYPYRGRPRTLTERTSLTLLNGVLKED